MNEEIPAFSLSGQVALVTGASGAIGGAIARRLHGAGAQLLLCGTREEVLASLCAELGENAAFATGDLAVEKVPASLVARAEEMFGKCDILICNAGVTSDGLALRMKDEDWCRPIEINLNASFRLVRAALRGMVRNRHGRIIAIGSVIGSTGNAGQANYAAAKAGLGGMIRSLALEFATRGITANVIAPGFVASPMTDKLDEAQRAAILSRIPANRIGDPDEVAACALFLASNEAAYITGATVPVNGGLFMAP